MTLLFWFFIILIWKLQGFRLGFARVLVLFFLRALAREKGFKWRVYYPLFLALCFDFALGINSGWQHYYLAILGGMLGLELAKDQNVFIQHLYLAVASWLMTAPLDLYEHHTISWMTPVWSMITIPLIALILYPLSVFSYVILDRIPDFLMSVWNQGIEMLLKLADHGFTFSVVNESVILSSLIFSIVTTVIFLKVADKKYRKLFIISCLITLFGFKEFNLDTKVRMKLIQLDVGQGDSLLVKKNNLTEMIDLGTSRDVKPEAMILHLAKYGENQVNSVLFSHLDEDHAGGLRLLLPWVPTDHVEVNSNLERTEMMRNWLQFFPTTTWCEKGCFKSGSVDWINAKPASSKKIGNSGNDLMSTVMIQLSEKEIYLALGDSDSKQEEIFWNRHHKEIMMYPRRILKISHHGSKNSSKMDFIEKVSPNRAVISVGFHNHYHHPHFSVINLLMKEHIPIHRTDRDGDFEWQ